ncbi:hypothetical protein [Bradyrhizobium centrosematis]|uniref:hypothetical protein n=1 Tax=Bradyrhizobium centrosematis TaxID=1300039 RepID=UPI00388FD563
MDWKKELDALVRETAELVARTPSLNVHPQATIQTAAAAPMAPAAATNAATVEPFRPVRDRTASERERIMARVQGFRAHQERMRREREDFYDRTMRRARDLADGRTENCTNEDTQ